MQSQQGTRKLQQVSSTWPNLILEEIDRNGIPAPWQEFGQRLSVDGSLSTQIVEAVTRFRTDQATKEQVYGLYELKIRNLGCAREIVGRTMEEYDSERIWEALDRTLGKLNMSEFANAIEPQFNLHPFPVVINSLKYNWEFMTQNGIKAFYRMTDSYLEKIQFSSVEAQKAFRLEVQSREGGNCNYSHLWLITSDLRSIEVPTHCDVCRISMAPVLLAYKLRIA